MVPSAVVRLDLGLPGLSDLEALPLIKQRLPQADVIVQTVFEDPNRICLALSRGANGYLLKSTPLAQLQQVIREVAHGGSTFSPSVARRVLAHFKPGTAQHPAGLSPREQQVFEARVDGLADKEIAQRLNLGLETVHTYVKNMYHKRHVSGRIKLLSRAARGPLWAGAGFPPPTFRRLLLTGVRSENEEYSTLRKPAKYAGHCAPKT